LSGWQELPHPRAERRPHRRCGTWCPADALYVVNDALGSFLLRANEVIDQVPMSACGPFSDMPAALPNVRCWGEAEVPVTRIEVVF
jgi:hypothetical protein